MNNLLQKFEKQHIEKLTSKKRIPTFRTGDTIKVTLKIVEGEKSRLQAYEGMCISRKNNSINSKFTVRKISHGEGVERVFPLFSPNIEKIEVIRKGDVKRSKLYYLRNRTGKKARIADRDRGEEADQYELAEIIKEEVETQVEADDKKNNEVDQTESSAEQSKKDTLVESKAEEKKLDEEKSESSAPKAEETKDESKS
tara:strand:- start:3196 stop:3789 length:594 start_codon:yes stop_codon:yes gene_type:complete